MQYVRISRLKFVEVSERMYRGFLLEKNVEEHRLNELVSILTCTVQAFSADETKFKSVSITCLQIVRGWIVEMHDGIG